MTPMEEDLWPDEQLELDDTGFPRRQTKPLWLGSPLTTLLTTRRGEAWDGPRGPRKEPRHNSQNFVFRNSVVTVP